MYKDPGQRLSGPRKPLGMSGKSAGTRSNGHYVCVWNQHQGSTE
jgi:hypothetical protein